MKPLTKQQEKTIKNIFEKFVYLTAAVGHDPRGALNFFRRGRDVTKREAEMLVLRFLNHYETFLRDKPFYTQTGLDSGLYELLYMYERIRGVSGFEDLDLVLAAKIYSETRE